LGNGFDQSRLCPTDAPLKSPEDAREACSLALRASSSRRPGEYGLAADAARAFLRLRPESGFGYKVFGYASEKHGDPNAAREAYRRSVELEPDSLDGQLLYAQFLAENGDPNKAEQILEPLWQAGRSRDLVAIAMVNLWGEQKEFARCLEVLEEAAKSNPRNAYLWQQMTACRMQTQGPAAAIEPLTRAVELYPERGPFRGSLAHLLETTGDVDEAEKHFRKLLDVEPDNPVVYCWLAQFLSKHRLHAVPEALKMAEKALDLPPHASLPREKIEQMIAEIRTRMEPSGQK
jgi:predicted Zn-dependent protease